LQIVKKLTDDQSQQEYMKLVARIRGLKVATRSIPLQKENLFLYSTILIVVCRA